MAGTKKTGPAHKHKKPRAAKPWTPRYPQIDEDFISPFDRRQRGDSRRIDHEFDEY